MANYFSELENSKKYVGNVIIKILGEYFSIHTPDSGLTLNGKNKGIVSSLVINPTSIDPRRVTTTIASYSFKLLDKGLGISNLVKESGEDLIGQSVEIWLGRVNVGMDFADYYKLPVTRVKKISRQDNAYSFSSVEEADRMNRPIYDTTTRLNGSILSLTTVIGGKDAIDDFPASGYFKLDDEIIGYTSKNNTTKQFLGCTRGEFGTTPAAHDDNTSFYTCEQITDNPLNLVLRLLTSGGGGGSYDNLVDGLAIDQSLIDIAGIEDLRESAFSLTQFTLAFYNIENALQYIETELLAPLNVRFTYSRESKLTLALLDKAKFVDSLDIIDNDTVVDFPKWEVTDDKVTNEIQIEWDYSEGTGKYLEKVIFEDATSIALYGRKSPLRFKFKGVKASLNGLTFLTTFANSLLARLSIPTPEISVKTQIDKSLLNIADKSLFESNLLPDANGNLNFASELEVVNRAINYQTGDVSLKLAFTSFTGIRSCYIAPSDTIQSITSQKVVTLGAGRGDLWEAGFQVRLWNNLTNSYEPDSVNEIESITGDQITFVNNWATVLTTDHRIKFADYDDCNKSQKRYCFIGDNSLDFADGGKRYSILT